MTANTMEKVLTTLGVFIIILIGSTSCKDSETKHIPNVYVAGATITKSGKPIATYWQNQKEIPLTQDTTFDSFAASIVVDNNDVHVVGYQEIDPSITGSPEQAMYWKNDNPIILADNGSAKAVTVAHGNVYVAGEANIDGIVSAVYWKDGKVNVLTGGDEATSIAIVNEDIYVAGVQYTSFSSIAKYWKNGVAVTLTDGTGLVYVNGIAVVGNDVYVVGSEDRRGKYWKNGVPTFLTHNSGSAEAITAAGNDIYIVGYEFSSNPFIGIAKYWKNGIEVPITDGSQDSNAHAIAIYGSDVYAAGYQYPDTKYWKNNQSYILSSARKSPYVFDVNSIFVH